MTSANIWCRRVPNKAEAVGADLAAEVEPVIILTGLLLYAQAGLGVLSPRGLAEHVGGLEPDHSGEEIMKPDGEAQRGIAHRPTLAD